MANAGAAAPELIGDALAAGALVWSLAVLAVAIEAIRRSRRPGPPPVDAPVSRAVLLVRPCAGLDADLERALLSSRVVRGLVAQARVVFAVATPSDPAHEVAARVAATLRGEGIDAAVAITHPRAVNAKSAQLAAVADGAAEEVVVCADSDVDLGAEPLRALLGAIEAGHAAAWAPPIEVAPRTTADRASRAVLGASLHAFTLLGPLDAGGFVGKLFAVRATDLARAGGFEAASHVLGEDVELGRRMRAVGGRVASVSVPARSLAAGRDGAAVLERFARWIQVVKAHRAPLLLAYPALFVATPPILATAALAVAIGGSSAMAVAASVVAIVARVTIALAARRASGRRLAGRGAAWVELAVEIALADALLAAAFVRALSRSHVRWRGRTLEQGRARWREVHASSGERPRTA